MFQSVLNPEIARKKIQGQNLVENGLMVKQILNNIIRSKVTYAANLAWNSLILAGSLPPRVCKRPWQAAFHENKPCMMAPPKPIFWPGAGVAWSGL